MYLFRALLGVISIIISICGATSVSLRNLEHVNVTLSPTENGIRLVALQYGKIEILTGNLNLGKDLSSVRCVGLPVCEIGDSILSVEDTDMGMKITWETRNKSIEFQDCFDMPEEVYWFGGPQRRVQTWPINKMIINGSLPYVSRRDDNFAIAERYWLNSFGAFIFLEEFVPLFVDQNMAHNDQVCFSAKLQDPYINREKNILEYYIGFNYNMDALGGHAEALNNYLGTPLGHPNELMISEPIWTTWAKYKRNISDSNVLEFAQAIKDNGYNGQIEIDDKWETCYGTQEFDKERFPDIINTVKKIKEMGFRVTLWVHPFVNSDCQEISEEGLAKGYFVVDKNNGTKASWWNGDDARVIDFTNPEAADWWSARVRNLLEETGIDSIKCDAGETDYGSEPSVYPYVNPERVPNVFTTSYVRTCAKFGDLVEVRAGSRTQNLPVFVRMLDKDSNWKLDNGLPTLVTTLLQMNMNGFSWVLPDIIGGNGYNMEIPSAELLVRWTQATTFMPAMQFSYLPWEITSPDFDAPAIIKKFVDMHKNYTSSILHSMNQLIHGGQPANPPIWWIDPLDEDALKCDDEFLVGDSILVAPVLTEGATSRLVYLPEGNWRDGNNNTIYPGPVTLDYPADINTLPFFFRH